MLRVHNLSCGYTKKPVVEAVSLTLAAGEVLALLGPNGVGKTTFFKTLLGFLPPLSGQVFFQGQDIHGWSRKRFAQTVAYVPQCASTPFLFSARDVVVAGRNAYAGITSTPSNRDYAYADACMQDLGIWGLRHHAFNDLSGGEKQLVLIARAVTQEPQILIMDEPTSNLDYGNQVKVVNLVQYLAQRHMGVIMTTHSPDQVLLCRCQVVVFSRGRQIRQGDAAEVITDEMLHAVYGVQANVCTVHPRQDRPARVCVPTVNT